MTTQQAFIASNYETIASLLVPPAASHVQEDGAARGVSTQWIASPASGQPDHVPAVLSFTVGELKVLRLLADGRNERQIGDHLGLTLETVRIHVSNIYLKVYASSHEPRVP